MRMSRWSMHATSCQLYIKRISSVGLTKQHGWLKRRYRWPRLGTYNPEIEGLGSEQRHKVDSDLLQLLIHLLLYQYWHSEREWSGRGWSNEINNFRVQLELLFESRTLYVYCLQRIELIYSKAVKQAAFKSQFNLSMFPQNCPFTPEEILSLEFFPIIEGSNLA